MIGITGATGILGSILTTKLSKIGLQFSAFPGDLTSLSDVKDWVQNNDFDEVIHLAAVVATKTVVENPLLAFDVNVSGTINLLKEVIKKNNKTWFFYASTSHVYKSSVKPISEDDAIQPISLYGKTKFMAEEIILETEKLQPKNLQVCIGRIFSFYHNTQQSPFLYPNITKRLIEEDLSKPFFLHGADSVRDFLNAEEVADIIIKMLDKKSVGVYNIASGKETKIRDFVQSFTEKKLTIETNDNPTDYLVADIAKLKKEIE
jgi:nucleoside-diphosphate-sugar epimerase